ncbi:MAG: hypothetical protein Q9M40_12670 [Sulfurimonas sp.]|nr:hypothetical protein [Sulfurimonas sp.]
MKTVFNYQIVNPPVALDLNDLVGKDTKQHYPTITDDKGIKNLLLSIKEYQGENLNEKCSFDVSLYFCETRKYSISIME